MGSLGKLAIRDTDARLNVRKRRREDNAWYQNQLRQSTISIVSNRALHLSINRILSEMQGLHFNLHGRALV